VTLFNIRQIYISEFPPVIDRHPFGEFSGICKKEKNEREGKHGRGIVKNPRRKGASRAISRMIRARPVPESSDYLVSHYARAIRRPPVMPRVVFISPGGRGGTHASDCERARQPLVL